MLVKQRDGEEFAVISVGPALVETRAASPTPSVAHSWRETCSPIVLAGAKKSQTACKPGSVPAQNRRGMTIPLGRSLPSASRDRPGRRRESAPGLAKGLPSLLGLAPGGVCHATAVTGGAVRSYRTLSPLPPARKRARRFAFCGTVPGVAPAGRYPAPCFRGARTFLPSPSRAKSGHPAVWRFEIGATVWPCQ
jgi:hypothetical protein